MFFNIRVVAVATTLVFVCALVNATPITGKNDAGKIEQLNGMLLFESDILVGRVSENIPTDGYSNRGVGLTSGFARWENGVIPYTFHDNLAENVKTVVLQAIDHWNEYSSVTLIERDPGASDAASDYVQFVKGPGCASWVGRQGDVQEIWVSPFCTTGSMIHEIGHAVGLLHEHTRSDRDQYIEVLWQNIQQDKAFNFEINTAGSIDLGDYDYNSIMHYGDFFFSYNGEPTMRAINADPSDVMGQRRGISEGDIQAVDNLYGTDLALTIELEDKITETGANFTISNLHTTGAHDITLSFSVEGEQALTFETSDNIDCSAEGNQALCSMAVLPGGAWGSVAVIFDGVVTVDILNPILKSKTHDINTLNNAGSLNETSVPEVTRLDGSNATPSLAEARSGGGGAVHVFPLLWLMLTWLYSRRRRAAGLAMLG